MNCNGPCEQGRKPCPCPHACWRDEPPEHDPVRVIFIDAAIAAIVITAIAVIVWRVI